MSDAYTISDLNEMRSFSLQRKIQITTTRLIEWYNIYNGQVYLIFDGTPESRVLAELGAKLFASGLVKENGALHLVHVRTGTELPELDAYIAAEVDKLSRKAEVNIDYLEPEHRYDKVITKYGLPAISREVSTSISAARRGAAWAIRDLTTGKYKQYKRILDSDVKVSPYCCEIMKEQPYNQYEARTGLSRVYPTLAENSESTQTWVSLGCNSTETRESRPMSFWTRDDIADYGKFAGIDMPDFPVGCAKCMFGKSMSYYCDLYANKRYWDECVVAPGIVSILDVNGWRFNS
ncbi:hypothetical protein FACS1894184_13700 [Clostridia bacterium]|nr:hypothetical protein FACS1894184_13700 [Clostridia bacterium]